MKSPSATSYAIIVIVIAICWWAVLHADGLRAVVYARVVQPGGTIRLTCTVPKDPEHRLLRMGVEGLRTSERELEGDRAAITHSMYIEHVPCGFDTGYCAVANATRKPELATDRFLVAGCDSTIPY